MPVYSSIMKISATSTYEVKSLLATAMGFSRREEDATDNDQYLWNCAFIHVAGKQGVNFKFTDDRILFSARLGNRCMRCSNGHKTECNIEADVFADGAPPRRMSASSPDFPEMLVWHLGGHTGLMKIGASDLNDEKKEKYVNRLLKDVFAGASGIEQYDA